MPHGPDLVQIAPGLPVRVKSAARGVLTFTGSAIVEFGSPGPHITLVIVGNPVSNPYNGFAEVTDVDGVSTLAVNQVTVSGALGAHSVVYKATSSGGRPDLTLTVVFTIVDTVAPVLTLPTDIKTGQTTATIGATTGEGGGTIYVVASTSATVPSAAQIIAGQDHTGSAAAAAGNAAVVGTGVKTVAVTGLTASTTYYGHVVQRDATSNTSNVVSGDGFTTDAAVGLLLDAISGVSAVYSFRKLRNAYAGSCIRIRASGDNAETDVGFASNVVDNAAITSFIGTHGGSAFIVTWYDQSGNASNATMATASQQPAYIASGINSLPTARFDGTNDYLAGGGTTPAGTNQGTSMFVLKQTGTQVNNQPVTWSASGSNMLRWLCSFADTIYFDFGTAGAAGRINAAQPGGWDDAGHVVEGYRTTGNNQEVLIDGGSLVTGSSRTDAMSGSGSIVLGADASSIFFKGDLSEVIFLNVDTGSTNRAIIRKDGTGTGVSQGMGPYFGITVA